MGVLVAAQPVRSTGFSGRGVHPLLKALSAARFAPQPAGAQRKHLAGDSHRGRPDMGRTARKTEVERSSTGGYLDGNPDAGATPAAAERVKPCTAPKIARKQPTAPGRL